MTIFNKIGRGLKKGLHFVGDIGKKAVKEGKKGLEYGRDFVTDTLKKTKESANPFDMKGLLPVLGLGLVALFLLPRVLDSASNAKKAMDN